MRVQAFISQLESLNFENTFNPYFDRCDVYDYKRAPQRRRAILKDLLTKAEKVDVDAIWIGRDLGYRGGRRTGLALTDDVNFDCHLKRWSVRGSRLTKGTAVAERTASVIWSMLEGIEKNIFLWNVFPLHPYESGSPFSNRAHNAAERIAGEELLEMLIQIIQPNRLVAVGNDAEVSARKYLLSENVFKVRHPSYGGQSIFIKQIKDLYGLD